MPHPSYIFIVGSQRTGTTLLGQIIGAHPQAVLIDENNHVYRLIETLLAAPAAEAEALGASVASAQKLYRGDERFTPEGTLHPSVTHLVLKAPNATYDFARLRARQEGRFRFVFAVRDVRDVVCSMQRLVHVPMVENQLRLLAGTPHLATRFADDLARIRHAETPLPVQQALVWKIKTSLYREFAAPPLRAMRVRYEDLVSDPETWILRLLRHVGLSAGKAEALHHEAVFQGLAPGFTVRARAIDQTSLYRWRQRLSPETEGQIWQVAGGLMSELGYPRQPPRIHTPRATIAEEKLAQPIVGAGHAGPATPLLPRLLQAHGVFLGNRLGASGRSSEWMDLIYELAIKKLRGVLPEAALWRRELRARASHILSSGAWNPSHAWGWTLPETAWILPEIAQAFPRARFILLVQHPLDACLGQPSLAARTNHRVREAAMAEAARWAGRPASAADAAHVREAMLWVSMVTQATRFAEATDASRYQIVRAEDFRAAPQATADALASFLGVPPRPSTAPSIVAHPRPADEARAADVWAICEETAATLGYTVPA